LVIEDRHVKAGFALPSSITRLIILLSFRLKGEIFPVTDAQSSVGFCGERAGHCAE